MRCAPLQPQRPISRRLRTQARPQQLKPATGPRPVAGLDRSPTDFSPFLSPLPFSQKFPGCVWRLGQRWLPPVKPSKSSPNCFLQEPLGWAPRKRVKMTFKSQSPHRLLSRNAEEFLAHSPSDLWVLVRPGQIAGPRILGDGEWDSEAPFKVSECTRSPVQIFGYADRLRPVNPGRRAWKSEALGLLLFELRNFARAPHLVGL